MDLTNKVALITGGANGIGAETSIKLARLGADIGIVDLETDQQGEQVKDAVEELGRNCALIKADMSIAEQTRQCVPKASEQLGGIDVLVHCAGMRVEGSILEVQPENWYKGFEVHLHAVFHLSRMAVPIMKERGGGNIVLISSISAIRGTPDLIGYCTAKGAIPQMARCMALELADDNIRVNCVSPGIIRTRIHRFMTDQRQKHNLENRIPLHREGKPEEVAEAIAFLISNDYMTGENIVIDGGMTMRIIE